MTRWIPCKSNASRCGWAAHRRRRGLGNDRTHGRTGTLHASRAWTGCQALATEGTRQDLTPRGMIPFPEMAGDG